MIRHKHQKRSRVDVYVLGVYLIPINCRHPKPRPNTYTKKKF